VSHWIVTGASRGLGRHIAQQLADRGHTVIACARDHGGLDALAASQPEGRIRAVALDLSNAASIQPIISAAIRDVGGIDGLVNNAGVGAYKPFHENSETEFLQTIQVNLTAVMQLCHAVLPHMIARKGGHIVNIGSDLGRRPLANMAAYVASKHGLTGFSHSLLREAKQHNIKVSLVNPGIIDTDFGGAKEGSKEAHWSLRPAALAGIVMQVIEQPGFTVIDELSVHPLGQGEF
jgi:short-subunit dehydrogenase